MPTFYLTSRDGSAATAFEPVDAETVRVETRYADGMRADEHMDREYARKVWALMTSTGAVRAAGWPVHLDDEARCEDPESHDGEECNCAELRAAGWTYCNDYTPGGAGWRRITPES
jgi:hypothetical protein